ncbi:MAG TPA: hypothetical protein VFV34_14875, partial [Blastocatellia bacterium]|nr:hypothetical protein [Blastocatellia bacterium]
NLAAYLAGFADIAGRGSVDLFEKLATVIAQSAHYSTPDNDISAPPPAASLKDESPGVDNPDDPVEIEVQQPAVALPTGRLEGTEFWNADKAFAILTASREIWLEASSSEALTLRPPRGSVTGMDLVRGRFVPIGPRTNSHRNKPD